MTFGKRKKMNKKKMKGKNKCIYSWMLWKWFFVPIFGLPQLTTSQALGIMVTARAILPFFCKKKTDKWEDLIGDFLYSTLLLGIGWVITWFI